MKFCPYCGNELNDNPQFCPYCGKSIAAEAPKNTENTNKTSTATIEKKAKKPVPKKKLIPAVIILLLIAALAAVFLFNPFHGNFSEDTDAIQKAGNSVVKIYMYDINGIEISTGSAFAALDKDIIITNHHCIEGNVYSIEAERADHSFFPVESVVAYDEEKDIAILRAPEGNLSPLKTGSSMDIKRGEKTVAIGSPIGIHQMISTGVFSNYLDAKTHIRILSTASISHGSSGGALLNNHGKVVGITSGAYEAGNDLYYSIPIYYAQELYDNRDPKNEITLAEFYNLSEHPYDVNYILAFGRMLNGKEVTIHGYASCIGAQIDLVSHPDDVIYIDNRAPKDTDDWWEKQKIIMEHEEMNYVLQIDTTKSGQCPQSIQPGDKVEIKGKIVYYPDSAYFDVLATTVKEIG